MFLVFSHRVARTDNPILPILKSGSLWQKVMEWKVLEKVPIIRVSSSIFQFIIKLTLYIFIPCLCNVVETIIHLIYFGYFGD